MNSPRRVLLPGSPEVAPRSTELVAPAREPRTPSVEPSNRHIAGPSGNPTSPETGASQAAGDFVLIGDSVVSPTQSRSTVNEPAVANRGRVAFYTGNHYAARSIDFGSTWTYVDPYADMPDFCCDQDVFYEPSRGVFLWYRQGVADSNGENRIRLGVSSDASTWWFYDFRPPEVNSAWTNQWFDYPHVDVSANHLYVTTNVYDGADVWQRTVIFRWPLQPLASGDTFSYFYYSSTQVGTFTTVGGATSTMYFASHLSNSAIRVFSWPESVDWTGITSRDVSIPAWTDSPRGSMSCPAPDGTNWCARSDDRILTGWVSGGVLGFMWNVAQGNGFPWPYAEAVTIDAATMAYLTSPRIWSPTNAWMYPAVYPNARGDLGVLAFWGNAVTYPSVALMIADRYTAPWTTHTVTQGSDAPSNENWGDYARVRRYSGSGYLWAGSGYTLSGGGAGADAVPRYYLFGRWDDIPIVTFETVPATCGSISLDGASYVHGQTVQKLPESYPVFTTGCPGYATSSIVASGGVQISGNTVTVSTSGKITAVFDDLPSVSVVSPVNGTLVANPSLNVSGSASDDGSGVNAVEVRLNGGAWTRAVYSTGSWSAVVTLREGFNTICARAIDNVGNVGPDPPPCASAVLDRVPPIVTITSPSNGGLTNRPAATVSGEATDSGSGLDRVEIRLNEGDWISTVQSQGIWSVQLTLREGANTVCARAFDMARNVGPTPLACVGVTLDTNPLSLRASGGLVLALMVGAAAISVVTGLWLWRRRRTQWSRIPPPPPDDPPPPPD